MHAPGATTRRNDYAAQKLGEALQCLVGEGPLRRRLTPATMPLIILGRGRHEDDEISTKVSLLVDELTQRPLTIEGHPIPRNHLSAKRAKEIASEIVTLFVLATLPD